MLYLIAGLVVAAIVVANSLALADILENDSLPPFVSRAWLTGVVLVPGLGALLWLRQRALLSPNSIVVPASLATPRMASAAEIAVMHDEIDRFRAE